MMGRGGMMSRRTSGGMGMGGVREWDQQMLGMHQAMAGCTGRPVRRIWPR